MRSTPYPIHERGLDCFMTSPRLPQLVAISGPSGVGKNAVIQELLRARPALAFASSLTTRAPRPTDVPGKYQYVSRSAFTHAREAGALLEWAEYAGNWYGTLKPHTGTLTIAEVDVQGARQIRACHQNARLIMLVPPGFISEEQLQILRSRLLNRGTEDEATISRRCALASEEIRLGTAQADLVVVNDRISLATAKIIHFVDQLWTSEPMASND